MQNVTGTKTGKKKQIQKVKKKEEKEVAQYGSKAWQFIN